MIAKLTHERKSLLCLSENVLRPRSSVWVYNTSKLACSRHLLVALMAFTTEQLLRLLAQEKQMFINKAVSSRTTATWTTATQTTSTRTIATQHNHHPEQLSRGQLP